MEEAGLLAASLEIRAGYSQAVADVSASVDLDSGTLLHYSQPLIRVFFFLEERS
jgi:hypothetical protein